MMASNTQTSGGKLASGGESKKAKTPTPLFTEGNDIVTSGNATLDALDGNDVVYGTTADQAINGDKGNDWINGGGGADNLNGGDGRDWVSFQPYTINGTPTNPYGSGGVTVDLGSGSFSYFDPFASGGSGGTVTGTVTNFENVWGSEGDDSITGDDGDNDLHGGGGEDSINGAGGNDEIEGQAGDDDLRGGAGSDTFEFESTLAKNGVDTIHDLDVCPASGGTDEDVLDLSEALGGLDFGPSGGLDINDYVQIVDNGSGGSNLLVDLDGTGSGGAEIWANLKGVTSGEEVHVSTGSGSTDFDGCIEVTGGGSGGVARIFVTSELGGITPVGFSGGFNAFYDTNDNGKLDQFEVWGSGAMPVDWATVDFANDQVTVEFVGLRGGAGVDLSGFTSDDSIIVNWSKSWAGTGWTIEGSTISRRLTALQLGTLSFANEEFRGFTYASYSLRNSSTNATFRSQIYFPGASGSFLGVAVTFVSSLLAARYANISALGGNVIPGLTYAIGVGSLEASLATWTSGTTIQGSQLTVVWPNTLSIAG